MNVLIGSGREGLYLSHLRLDLLVLVSPGTHIGRAPSVLENSGSSVLGKVCSSGGDEWEGRHSRSIFLCFLLIVYGTNVCAYACEYAGVYGV